LAITRRFRWLALGLCAAWLIPSRSFAADEKPAAPHAAIDGYTDYKSFAKDVEALAKPGIADVGSLGTTLGGRKVLLITVGTGKPAEKPALLIVGNVSAPQLFGSELAVRIARRLIAGAEKDPDVKAIVDRYTFYIIPRPSPDASEAFFQPPFREREGNLHKTADDWDVAATKKEAAKNSSPHPGPLPEGEGEKKPSDDLNHDGQITMLRVADPSGHYRAHPDDSRVLIEADPLKNEHGEWDLYPEARKEDDDTTPARSDGVAFDHNFPFRYPYFKPEAGPHAVSESETRAVADFAFNHPNIAAVFCFSPEDNLMHPWKPVDDKGRVRSHIQGGDAPFCDFIAEKYRKLLGAGDAPESPTGEGSFSEWAYYQFGRWSFAARGWWVPTAAGEKQSGDKPSGEKPPSESRGAEFVNALRWFQSQKIDGFVNWQPIENPDFPGKRVEVGGFKPFLLHNPPAKELDPLAEKHFRFVIELARLLPQIKIQETKVEPLGDGIQRITATIVNPGYLPTMSEMGSVTQEVYPLLLKLDAPKGATYLKGSVRQELGVIRGGGKTEWIWLIRTPGGKPGKATITVSAPSVGSDSATIELK
jgi:hypothetical protein